MVTLTHAHTHTCTHSHVHTHILTFESKKPYGQLKVYNRVGQFLIKHKSCLATH